MTNLDQWLDDATPDRREIVVCLDRRLVSELAVARKNLEAIKEGRVEAMLGNDEAEQEVVDQIVELERRMTEKSKLFAFEGLGWGGWRDLVAKHPPKPEQSTVFAQAVQLGFMPHSVENVMYNAETFVPAAIHASCVEPGISESQAATLLRKAPPGVIERIWTAVLEVNLAGADDPFVAPGTVAGSD